MAIIGIIGAMEEEIALFKSKLNIITAKNIVDVDFYVGTLADCNVVLARSGIGKVNAAICAQVLIDKYGADMIINVGVAGGLSPNVHIGDIVISSDVVQHDFDTTVFGDEPGMIPRMNRKYFAADETLINKASAAAREVCLDKRVVIGRIASGDQFISSSEQKERIVSTFSAVCAEMEGAAIGHVCTLNRIPFVIIRSISDAADEKADTTFEEFAAEAAKTAAALVESLIKSL
ncbi:5'-methylthioadenosine/S-adenosylhomocysteine nucleosidase [Clostridia bacterium]|nr:5'-methylthioadenosine/S-adenosylhomocysteine nucleosidase [Clostridia bacterium]